MGGHQRYSKSQSFQSFAKSFAVGFLCLGLLSCSHPKAVLPADMQAALQKPEAQNLAVSSLGIQLTQLGDNESPSLSADGTRLVFVSRNRPSHSNRQVYLYELESLKERRLTYQDGDCSHPVFLKSGEVIYASTTDEEKERPRLLQKHLDDSPFAATELYRMDLEATEIQRLTQKPGFDGNPSPRPDRPESVMYNRWNGSFLEFRQLGVRSLQTIPFLSKNDRSIESLRLSPHRRQWAWIERLKDSTSQVVLSSPDFAETNQKTLQLPKGNYKDLNWISDQKLIMSARTLKKNFQIYTYDLSTQCLQSIVESGTDLSSPQIQFEKNALVFVSSNGGQSQIYYKSLPTSETCLKWDGSK